MQVLSKPAAFAVAGASMVAMLAGSATPSPLYPVYQQLWGFSSFTLTVIFAVYVLALLVSLLTVGSISDVVGRRPVAVAAMGLLAASMLLFAVAGDVPGLVVARTVQGLATGAATGTITAMIVDQQPSTRLGSTVSSASPAVGLFAGAVLAGALVQFAPYPRVVVFGLMLVVYVVLLALLLRVPEAPRAARPTMASVLRALRPSAGVPVVARSTFVSLVPAMAATWALGGFYLSLGSSVLGNVLGVDSHFVVGLGLGAFFLGGAGGAIVTPRLTAVVRRPVAYSALGIGVLVTLAATLATNLPLYVAGSVVAGYGFGGAFVVVIAAVAAVTPAEHRGQTFATMFVVSYLAFSLPALVAGLEVGRAGLSPTVVSYSAFEIVLVGLASATAVVARRRRQVVAAGLDRECPQSVRAQV